jgi:hypothetical protein
MTKSLGLLDRIQARLLLSDKLVSASKYWSLLLLLSSTILLFAHVRLIILVPVPLFILVINGYFLFLFKMLARRSLSDARILLFPRLIVVWGNIFFALTFALLAVASFLPTALYDAGAYLIEPFTTSELIASIALFILSLAALVFGSLLATVASLEHAKRLADSAKQR